MAEFDRSAFIGRFQEEATDLLQRLNEGVISLEGDPGNCELVDQMLRDAHTLKGSARMVGLIDISDIAHRLEDAMVSIRDGGMAYTKDMSDAFFEALDVIVHLTEVAGKDVEREVDLPALQARLTEIAEGARSRISAQDVDDEEDASEATSTSAEEALDREESLQPKVQNSIRIKTDQVDGLLNLVSETVISQIKYEQRAHELRKSTSEFKDVWQAWSKLRSVLAALRLDDEATSAHLTDAIGVLDTLIAEQRQSQATLVKGLTDDVSRGRVIVNDLQEQGMRLRMLPLSTVFAAFPRAMRDLARSFKKDVELVLEGGDTQLDKKLLEEINDPLIHIMRNAVDHGIEPAHVRSESGKPEKAVIRMTARQEGDHIVIEVSDDGAGIDPDEVRAVAVRKGYITESESEAMPDRAAIYLVFEKGFSTSPIITEISGRGVGMDVVREFIVEKLKGSLDVTSRHGEGTTFKLTIPLTLAIIRALMLRVGESVYALPTASVEETKMVEPSEVMKIEGQEVIRSHRRTIPLVRLADILGVHARGHRNGKIPIASVGFSGQRIGFVVDALVGEQQIVIKTLGSHLRKVDNVAGVTILGAGEVVPILNVPDLMTNARDRGRRRGVAAEKAEARSGPKRVLICEDSFTTRELERSIFEAAGYEVEVAMDGAQGLAKLKEGLDIDAVVTDVQMPNMTGFELTRAIKSDSRLHQIPVIIVTSLERTEEKTEGINAGADAYITKSVLNQDTLLDAVERLIE